VRDVLLLAFSINEFPFFIGLGCATLSLRIACGNILAKGWLLLFPPITAVFLGSMTTILFAIFSSLILPFCALRRAVAFSNLLVLSFFDLEMKFLRNMMLP